MNPLIQWFRSFGFTDLVWELRGDSYYLAAQSAVRALNGSTTNVKKYVDTVSPAYKFQPDAGKPGILAKWYVTPEGFLELILYNTALAPKLPQPAIAIRQANLALIVQQAGGIEPAKKQQIETSEPTPKSDFLEPQPLEKAIATENLNSQIANLSQQLEEMKTLKQEYLEEVQKAAKEQGRQELETELENLDNLLTKYLKPHLTGDNREKRKATVMFIHTEIPESFDEFIEAVDINEPLEIPESFGAFS